MMLRKLWIVFRQVGRRLSRLRFRRLSLQLKVVTSFAMIVLIVGLVAVYNLQRVEKISEQFIEQNAKIEKQLLAVELKQSAQKLDNMGSGLALSGERSIIEQYDAEKDAFLSLVSAVGDQATSREERKWRASMTTTAGEFADNFNHIVAILNDNAITEDERAAKLRTRYIMSQAHKTYIFELTDQFNDVFTAEAAAALQTSDDLLEETSRVLIIAIGIVIILSIIVTIVFIRAFVGPIRRLQLSIRRVAEGDLTVRVGSTAEDELGALSRSLDEMTTQMAAILSASFQVADAMKQVSDSLEREAQLAAAAGGDISKAMNEIALGSDQQATQAEISMNGITQLEEQVLGIKQLTDSINQLSIMTSGHTRQGADAVEVLNQSAKQTETRLEQMVSSLYSLTASSKQISQISTTIEEISSQTNVLAVNATIEAARAGEHGRGFAVIASRIRELSDETKTSSRHIYQIIQSLQAQMTQVSTSLSATVDQVRQQNRAMDQTSASFSDIDRSARLLTGDIEGIFGKVNDTITKNKAVVEAFRHVLSIAEETAAGVQEVNSSATEQAHIIHQIADQANTVNDLSNQLFAQISRFKIS